MTSGHFSFLKTLGIPVVKIGYFYPITSGEISNPMKNMQIRMMFGHYTLNIHDFI